MLVMELGPLDASISLPPRVLALPHAKFSSSTPSVHLYNVQQSNPSLNAHAFLEFQPEMEPIFGHAAAGAVPPQPKSRLPVESGVLSLHPCGQHLTHPAFPTVLRSSFSERNVRLRASLATTTAAWENGARNLTLSFILVLVLRPSRPTRRFLRPIRLWTPDAAEKWFRWRVSRRADGRQGHSSRRKAREGWLL
ncbi:hypothetical protein GQ53DRAFT_552376 [Thozetella sp. PMI_491]|nr:hypothetical protein GQ53DRAFT_552376 [Thozetella sp. PMI_491]